MTDFSLAQAVDIATRAHEGQLDKAGVPYIHHPLRVMAAVDGEQAKMAAVLHDVIEDTGVTAEDLRAAGCPERVVTAVLALSKRPGEPMEGYLRRAAEDDIAIVVKHADIADNSGPERLDRLDPATQDRLRAKYAKALGLLAEYRD
ncbi:(p)ppGpp synthase/HD superfamily hydrolase [Crossiella equi]|uniref:(P)ppGpp synthase/HD superfamily hydrolase n=1 Tax=Crossiella equi TaxID=130796 RepID=A0ABS5AC19_9PSEU|nr:HD domain-containing protein [Crossiella equi]MBP2474119.1 (p)ppGpp synthase/HD superfamily hydrolase [Crossiella equi]